jgi:GT2 family glycosyltransferase
MQHKPLSVVFCLPGNSFGGNFLAAWTDLIGFCLKQGIQPLLSRRQSCNSYYVRNMCLGADVVRGKDQKPFDGKIDYDFIMWIDSGILFTPQQFMKLLGHGADIVSGVYLMEDGKSLATVREWDEEYFTKNGHFKFMTVEDLTPPHPQPPLLNKGEGESLIEVAYTGMGFMLVKRGVFEKLEYPWFRPLEKKIGDMVDFTMEDVAFCLRAREAGFKILIDPAVRVGHEKKIVLG